MRLTPEVLVRIMMALQTQVTESGQLRHKAISHVPINRPVPLLTEGGTPIGLTWLRNLSSEGVQLLHGCRVPPGLRFCLRLPQPPESSLRLTCRVIGCEEAATDLYDIAAEFTAASAEPGSLLEEPQPLTV